jgi:hypothetical protein
MLIFPISVAHRVRQCGDHCTNDYYVGKLMYSFPESIANQYSTQPDLSPKALWFEE